MKTRLITVAMVAVVAMLLAGISVSVLAAAPRTPFKGTVEGTETGVVNYPQLIVDGRGSGNATHLGKYTVTYHAEPTLTPDGGGSSTGDTIHFIAANGDTLDATGNGVGVPTGEPGVNKVTQVYTITGGTGRFAGATGTFTMVRLANGPTGVTSGTFDGTIVLAKGK